MPYPYNCSILPVYDITNVTSRIFLTTKSSAIAQDGLAAVAARRLLCKATVKMLTVAPWHCASTEAEY